MSCLTHQRNILLRDGTNQYERLLDALRPGFVLVDERSREDLLKFVQDFALQVQYYNASGARDGDWTAFFDDFSRSYDPHIALMLTFLELFKYSQDHINESTRNHLEYYYKRILQIKERPAVPDTVNLLVELAKNTNEFKLAKGTLVKAGKDASGVEMFYETEREIVLNKTSVESLRTIYADKSLDYHLYAAPKANTADGIEKELEGDEPRWHTFGMSQSGLPAGQWNMTDAEIGFGISSQVLLLKEGSRKISLDIGLKGPASGGTISLQSMLGANYSEAFFAYLSGEKGWLGPYEVKVSQTPEKPGLLFVIELGAEEPPVLNYDDSVIGEAYETKLPMLKIIINKDKQPYPYQNLNQLRLVSMKILADVKGVSDLVLQNDLGILDSTKPFQPFGSAPGIGSAFYVGSEEIFNKKLDSLVLRYKWKDLPGDYNGFETYYNAYDKQYKTDNYKFTIKSLQKKTWVPASGAETPKLFDWAYTTPGYNVYTPQNNLVFEMQNIQDKAVNPIKKKTLKKKAAKSDNLILNTNFNIVTEFYYQFYYPVYYPGFFYFFSFLSTSEISRSPDTAKMQFVFNPNTGKLTKYDHTINSGFIKLELANQDFGHKAYASVYAKKAMELSKYIADGSTTLPKPVLPNEPYTPVMEYLKVDYTSSQELDISLSNYDKRQNKFFHLEAFGFTEAHPFTFGSELPFFPQYTDEGSLYIGLKDLDPPCTLSLLFQIAESSSDPNVDSSDIVIQWAYLDKSGWTEFNDQQIVSDSTNMLKTSGIILFDIPKEAIDNNSRMPGGLHWIRASVAKDSAGVNQMIDIRAQAVSAVFVDKGNDPVHLKEPLKAATISKLAIPVPQVKKIMQPFASFGGKMAEGSSQFFEPYYTRVSERLRHKNRAVTYWDMERMVLEEFPSIYKVKCLTHSSNETDIAPGNITMVVIENIRNKNAVNPLQPRTSLISLANIKSFLEKYVSAFVEVFVQNPVYEEILVDFKVSFRPGYDAGFYKQQLNEDIKKFLSPWAYTEGEDIMFGNIIYKSSILNYIEEREYVDFVTNFKMYQITESWGIGCMEVDDDFVVGDQDTTLDVDQAEAKTSRSILVSALQHQIYVITAGENVCEGVKE